MTRFAIQVDLTDGGTHHFFGHGAEGYGKALLIRDGWRNEHPDNFYTFTSGAGQPVQIKAGDIRDVRVLLGGGR